MDDERPKSHVLRPPQRYVFATMISLGLTASYCIRNSWLLAMSYMVKPTIISYNFTRCDKPLIPNDTLITPVSDFYEWTKKDLYLFQVAFFLCYIIAHVPAGVLSDLYGGKHLLGFSILSQSFIHLFIPIIIIQTHGNVISVIILSVLMGITAGIPHPAAHALLAYWTPLRDRGKMGALISVSIHLGTSITYISCFWMIESSKDWGTVFYVFGAVGAFWFFFWYSYFHSKPVNDYLVTQEELMYLESHLQGLVTYEKKTMKWKSTLLSLPLWALTAVTFGHSWIWHIMSHIIPIYQIVFGVDVRKSYEVASLVYAIMVIIIIINGCFVDFVVKKGAHMTTVRKIYVIFGTMGPGVFLVASMYPDCEQPISAAFFVIGMSLMSCVALGTGTNSLDLAPNFSGTVMGISNGIGCIAITAVLKINTVVVSENSPSDWVKTFWLYFGVLTITCLFFMICGSGETQKWNNIEKPAIENTILKNFTPQPIGDIESETETEWSSELSGSFIK